MSLFAFKKKLGALGTLLHGLQEHRRATASFQSAARQAGCERIHRFQAGKGSGHCTGRQHLQREPAGDVGRSHKGRTRRPSVQEASWWAGATPEASARGKQVDTGGGAYVGGSVNAGGDFVGRDKVVHGDQITTGDVSGTGIAIGRGAQANVTRASHPAIWSRCSRPCSPPWRERHPPTRQPKRCKRSRPSRPRWQRASRLMTARWPGSSRAWSVSCRKAVGAMVSTFGSPILGGIAGPVTKHVLERFEGSD